MMKSPATKKSKRPKVTRSEALGYDYDLMTELSSTEEEEESENDVDRAFIAPEDDDHDFLSDDLESEDEQPPPAKKAKLGRTKNWVPKGAEGRSRTWCWVLNNYTPAETDFIDLVYGENPDAVKYFLGVQEVGKKNGTPHWQGFVSFHSEKSWGQVIAIVPPRSWCEPTKDPAAYVDYCKKTDGLKVEHGTPPRKKGASGGEANKRKWHDALECAKKGDMVKLGELHPQILIQCHRNLKALEQEFAKAPSPLSEVCGYWLQGPSGSGKSDFVTAKFPNAYQKPNTKWWPHYHHHDVVVMHDIDKENGKGMAGNLKIWTDKNPFSSETKGSALLIRPKIFIITSQYSIGEIWKDPKAVAALSRRCHIMNFKPKSWEDPDARITPAWDAPRDVDTHKAQQTKPLNFYPPVEDEEM